MKTTKQTWKKRQELIRKNFEKTKRIFQKNKTTFVKSYDYMNLFIQQCRATFASPIYIQDSNLNIDGIERFIISSFTQ